MTREEINRAVAERVMGWEFQPPCIDAPLGWWNSPDELDVDDWDPYHRIEHAWMVVERVTSPERTVPQAAKVRFVAWFNGAQLWKYSAEDAAKEICLAVMRLLEEEGR